MSSSKKSRDLGRISVYDYNIDDIKLTSSETQLKNHTGYDEEHLRRLKYLFQQITGPEKKILDVNHFESAARSICHSLTESNEAHRLAEILFKAYDKNTNGSIDFHEMVDFVWTIIDAPHEEQIGGLYQALRESNGKLSRDGLFELITILKEDFQPKISTSNNKNQGQLKSLKTDEEIRNRVDECLQYYKNSSDGIDLNHVIDYFLGAEDPLAIQVKARWTARVQRRDEKKNQFSSVSSQPRNIQRQTASGSSNSPPKRPT